MFVVGLNEQDFDSFAGSERVIADHLEAWLHDEADRLGFTSLAPFEVELAPRHGAKPRAIEIEGSISEPQEPPAHAPQPLVRTEAFAFHRPVTIRKSWILEVSAGPLTGIAHWIGKRETTVGRSLDNDFVIDAPDVSRHHATIELQDRGLRVVDLDSLNGTFVNQRPVQGWALVDPGDSVTFGLVHTRVFVDSR
jgi:hypothetical protein